VELERGVVSAGEETDKLRGQLAAKAEEHEEDRIQIKSSEMRIVDLTEENRRVPVLEKQMNDGESLLKEKNAVIKRMEEEKSNWEVEKKNLIERTRNEVEREALEISRTLEMQVKTSEH